MDENWEKLQEIPAWGLTKATDMRCVKFSMLLSMKILDATTVADKEGEARDGASMATG